MIKTKIIETTEKYDKDGKLVEKITREETTEDDKKGNTTLLSSDKWLGRPMPNIVPCCGGNESIKITY